MDNKEQKEEVIKELTEIAEKLRQTISKAQLLGLKVDIDYSTMSLSGEIKIKVSQEITA